MDHYNSRFRLVVRMPSTALKRRRKLHPDIDPGGPRIGLPALALSMLSLAGLGAAAIFFALVGRLPDVSQVELQFAAEGGEAYQPLRLYDRTGEVLLYEHLHPAVGERAWVQATELPEHVVDAMLAALDPRYWEDSGNLVELLMAQDRRLGESIAARLVRATLLPPIPNRLAERLTISLLTAQLIDRYPKERILNWYLNSADFGQSAFGLDSAALLYFGKHAPELTLSEASLLAAIAQVPSLDPWQQSVQARVARRAVLRAMEQAELIEADEVRRAARMPLGLRPNLDQWSPPDYALAALREIESLLGADRLGRSGLRALLSIDHELQEQAGCVSESHLARLAGEPLGTSVSTSSGEPCVAASLLPTLRPGDAGIDHRVDEWGLLILDPERGEILAAHGRIDQPRVAGRAIDPFIYLTAFAQGSTPATMVLDLREDLAESRGPVRMRTAVANLFPGASDRLLTSIGQRSFTRTLEQVGITLSDGQPSAVSLAEIATGYGIIAADGLRIGVEHPVSGIRPTLVLKLETTGGDVLYEYSLQEQAVLSPQLAYLMVDVLGDDSARWMTMGQGNPLELGVSAAAISVDDSEHRSNWTVGFTPQRVVGVWIGGSEMRGVDRLNGAAPIWHAVTRFAVSDLQSSGWNLPPGLTEREVCDPSGLLPTLYCPEVVTELFIQGTEPTHFDNLYRPLRVNRETGKLATLFTPLDAVEERVYFIPPPDAQQWAELKGVEVPPEEYDALTVDSPVWPGVSISSPEPFEVVGQQVQILGEAAPEGFRYYRLQYGQGLNPATWVQIGEDESRPIRHSWLGSWPTDGLEGLYTLQLLVILTDGQVRTAAIPVTIDNHPPQVQIVSPQEGAAIRRGTTLFQADAADDVELDRVEFWVDGRRVGTATLAPYIVRWLTPNQSGQYELQARAYDRAGNQAMSEAVLIEVVP